MRSALFAVVSILFACAPTLVTAADHPPYNPAAKASLVRIGDDIVWSRAADQRLPHASLTKLMLALLVLDDYNPNTVVTVSKTAANEPPSKLGLHAGDRLRLEDVLAAAMIKSANDACIALADWHSGSEAAFVERMNERALELGLYDTHFADACGFDAPGHYSTVHDIVALVDIARKNPVLERLMKTEKVTIRTLDKKRSFTLRNTNHLLGDYAGAAGGKTGYTNRAGPCLVAISERDGVEVLVVMLNASNRWPDARRTFDLAFTEATERRGDTMVARNSNAAPTL